MRLGIALTMAVLTITAAEVKTQEAAKMQGTGNSSSCPPYEMIPVIYQDCEGIFYKKHDAVIKFRLSIVSKLWDRLVNMNDTENANEVAQTLKEMYKLVYEQLETLSPEFNLRAEWDINENTTANGYYYDLPEGPTWFKKLNVESTPITDLLQDGKFINILLIDGFKDTECKYTGLEENTIVQAVGPLFFEKDVWGDGSSLEWTPNDTEFYNILWELTTKIPEMVGIQKWESTEGRGPCKGIMEGFDSWEFSECSSKEFRRHLESDGGQSMVKWVDTFMQKPEMFMQFRVFVNKKLADQVKPSTLKLTSKTVADLLHNTFLWWPWRRQVRLKLNPCDAEGITVLPWPDKVEGKCKAKHKVEGSGETKLEEAIRKTTGSKNIKTHLNLVMLDKSTFRSISDNLPGHREPITCSNADSISARTLIMWTETNDTMIEAKTKEVMITLAKKLGIKDNRQSSKVLKDKLWGNICEGMMEGHDTKWLSICSKDDFEEYLDTDEGSCLKLQQKPILACYKKPVLCRDCPNILGEM